MVSRNRKFPTLHGYSRNVAKRDAEQSVQDGLFVANELAKRAASGDVRKTTPGPDRHVALELGPQVPPRGIDIGSVVHDEPESAPALAPQPTWWQHLGQRLLRWVSWR